LNRWATTCTSRGRRQWSGRGADITEAEWQRLVESQPELRERLEWSDGNISAKNPAPALIDRMVVVARTLDAVVQGDDGETYESGQAAPTPYRPSLAERVSTFLRRLRPVRPMDPAPLPPFGVGDAVTDVFGKPATVIAMDPAANHGLGSITVRYADGRRATVAMRAHCLTRRD
jgi:hypothetical protein